MAGVTGWRSVLFVPANRPDLAAKAPRCGPDAVVVDLEDAVPDGAKAAAREALPEAVAALAGIQVLVRVNPVASGHFEADVAAALAVSPVALVVPKYEAPVDVGVPVVAGLETVAGVLDARSILGGRVVGCYFGAEDYALDLGGIRTPTNAEVAVPRAMVAMAARAAGVVALDMIVGDFGDDARFRAEAAEARALGYAGKLCIHPAQVPLANNAFVPGDEEVARARRVLAALGDAARDGRATAAFEGAMVDEVHARQARAVLSRAASTSFT